MTRHIYIFIKTNDISDELIEVSKQEIKAEYNKTKNDKYKKSRERTINYISFDISKLNDSSLLDSLNNLAYSFIDEVENVSFQAAAEKFKYTISEISFNQEFKDNSFISLG